MIENLKDQVVEVLKQNPAARNSDITLTIEIWRRYFPEKIKRDSYFEGVALADLYTLPREDNVKRVRAKLQEEALERISSGKTVGDERYYLPTDEKVAKQRQINAAVWEKALGYFRRQAPSQTSQLPSPVGKCGFRVVGYNKFLVDGSRGKKYQVEWSKDFGWKCECEAFKYARPGKDCKHVKSIKDYYLAKQKEEAARRQSNLF